MYSSLPPCRVVDAAMTRLMTGNPPWFGYSSPGLSPKVDEQEKYAIWVMRTAASLGYPPYEHERREEHFEWKARAYLAWSRST